MLADIFKPGGSKNCFNPLMYIIVKVLIVCNTKNTKGAA